jgi:glycerophosphoryl diester phosphodiesterase
MSDTSRQATRSTEQKDISAVRRRTFIRGTGGVAVGTFGTGTAIAQSDDEETESADEEDDDRDSNPDVIAHRGFAGLNPENTVGAVEAASQGESDYTAPSRSADSIEIDVVPTADEDVVVFHDNRLSSRDGGERGLTDTEGVVWETSTETVTSAKVLGTEQTVPLLEEVMDAIPERVGVNVELKNPGSFDLAFVENLDGDELEEQKDLWRPFVEDVLDIVDDFENELLFSSFYEAAVAVTREASDYAVAPLLWDSIDTGLEIAREYDAEAVHPPYTMIKETPFFNDEYVVAEGEFEDTDLVEVAHDEDRDVNPYTLTTWYQAEQLADAGVDGIIADYPDLLRFGAKYD